MIDDAQLLRRHVEDRSEAAFAELVHRHLGLVYHTAARQLGSDAHLAGDVAQGVFLLLAQRARGLLGHPSLAGWLHATTRFKVGETLRAERRRRVRETAAQLMHELNEADAVAWERLRPVIDDALSELDAADREAVLLRYFEQQPFASVAARLRLTEAAAYKRVERALDKLRQRLARRGVTSTAVALAAVLGAHTATAAPVGLAAMVTSSVLASGAPLAAAGFFTLMSTKTTAAVTALAVVAAGGLALRQAEARSAASDELAALAATTKTLSEQVRQAHATPATTPALAAPAAATPAPARFSALPGPGEVASRDESRVFLREHPELRAAFAAYLRVQLLEENAELIGALGLSEEQAERLVAVLAKGRTLSLGQHQLTLSERDFSSPREFGNEIRAVIGESGYQKYREVQQQVTARSLARAMTQALYATPMPLTAAQAGDLRRLVNAVAVDPALGKPHTSHWWYLPPERWARLIAEAANVMPEPQLAALREMQAKSTYQQAQRRAFQEYRERQQAQNPEAQP
ncbi:MAG TPA: sigma-70 family RNA polymerase sigma factor [Opitutaceae bacterium]